MRWAEPSAFIWLLGLPIYWVLVWSWNKLRAKKMGKHFGNKVFPFLTRSLSPQRRRWKIILQSLCYLFFVLALARPQAGESTQKIQSEGLELMLVVDVSESMLAEDVKPSRLEQAKAELTRLMDLMPGNRVGLIAFAGSSALLSPLSNDPNALKMYIESLTPESISTQGTNFEEALKNAKEAFERGGVTADENVKVSRVILVASDGEDHEPGALTAAAELAKSGIYIFTIAYGTEKGGPIPVRDAMNFLKGYKRDRKGETVITTVKGDALKKLAESGKGAFYFSQFGGSHLKKLTDAFSRMERAAYETDMVVQYEERFQIFIIIGILFLLLELVTFERRSQFKFWRGRFEVPKS